MKRMPVLFLAHGSPMNAIEDNAYTRRMNALGNELEKPKAILVISAHWLSAGTMVTHMKKPRTIHDFYGFPKPLFEVQYPAPGSPEVAERIKSLVKTPFIHLDDLAWGLDHGTWSVLKHLYPNADIPVLQLSIDMSEGGLFHFEVGQQLRALRDEGVLIIGSGNIVHNLQQIIWDHSSEPHAWAIEFDEWVKGKLVARDFNALCTEFLSSRAGQLSVPTPDHYYPLLYVLGASDQNDQITFDYEALELGSLSMRCVRFSS